jgi:hypothetical protein
LDENKPAHERVVAGHAQAFGAREALAGGGLGVVPVGAGAGVQQHADQHQVDVGAGPRAGVGLAEQGVEFFDALDAAGLEVAPAAVVRNGVPRVAIARDLGHGARRVFERVAVADAKPLRLAVARARQQGRGTLADGGGGAQQAGRPGGVAGVEAEFDGRVDIAGAAGWQAARSVDGHVGVCVVAGGHSVSPRPLAFLSSSASGTGPGVK